MNQLVWIGGGAVAMAVVGYALVSRPATESADPGNSLTYVGPGVPAVNAEPSAPTVTANTGVVLTSDGGTTAVKSTMGDSGAISDTLAAIAASAAALQTQANLAQSSGLQQTFLELFSGIAPKLDAAKGLTTTLKASVDNTGGKTTVDFASDIAPHMPSQSLLDEIASLKGSVASLTQIKDQAQSTIAWLTGQKAAAESAASAAAAEAAGAKGMLASLGETLTRLTAARDTAIGALSQMTQIKHSGKIGVAKDQDIVRLQNQALAALKAA